MLSVQICQIFFRYLFTCDDQVRLVHIRGIRPEKFSFRIYNDLITFCRYLFGKTFLSESFRIFCLEKSRFGHLKFCSNTSAYCSWKIQCIQCLIIVLDTRKLGCHGTVDSAINRSHHVADNIWFVHLSNLSMIRKYFD